MSSSKSAACMRPELVEGCTLTSTSGLRQASARIYDCTLRQAQAAEAQRTYARSAAAATKCSEHLSLHGIRCCRVFWMPLDAEIPACMIL